jgi:hypothetical protein
MFMVLSLGNTRINRNMSTACPRCGIKLPEGETCTGRFDVLQLKEVEAPAFYAVHHLSVPSYMLQHNAYSRRGWIEVRKLLYRFVHEWWTPARALRRYHACGDCRQRGWSLTRGEKPAGVELVAWTFTVGDVRAEDAGTYCADVGRWAERVLADSEELVRVLEIPADGQ